jgi:HEAT repeat protein
MMRRFPLTLLVLGLAIGCGRPTVSVPPTYDTQPSASTGPMASGKPLSAWVRELQSKDAAKRRSAAAFMGEAGNKHVVPHLAGALKDADAEVREAAARSLGTVGPTVREALPPLIEALKDSNDNVRGAAADGLAEFKEQAKAAAPTLTDIYKNTKNNDLRARAARALNTIDRDAAREAGVPQP